MSETPLATCAYGWGRTLKLYQKYLDVDGTLYELNNLMYVHATYRRVMRISSLRLEVQFHERPLLLRGISVNEDAELLVAHLKRYCPGAIIEYEMKAQEKAMQKSKLRKISMEKSSDSEQRLHAARRLAQQATESHKVLTAPSSTSALETPHWLLELAQDLHYAQSRKPYRALNESADMTMASRDTAYEQIARHLQADTLPSLSFPIPLHLTHDEQAFYQTEATLSAEPLSDGGAVPSYSYPARDRGTLILTNRRLIYMGRRGQYILGFTNILRVSRLRGAIALLTDISDVNGAAYSGGVTHTDHTRREIFQVERPLECALYLDSLLRQFYEQIATQHLSSNAISAGSMGTSSPSSMGVSETTGQEAIPQYMSHRLHTARATDGMAVPPLISHKNDAWTLNNVADIETRPLVLSQRGRKV